MGCRFPGADSVRAFWDLLLQGRCAIGTAPKGRWPHADGVQELGGFVGDLAQFDAAFFGIDAAEAAVLDPQQRLILEVAWMALEDAGIAPDSLRDQDAGIFIGCASHEFSLRLWRGCVAPFAPTGTSPGLAANRLSYFLGTQGPSLTVDSACSSSLTAVHMAHRALQQGDCDIAIVGGVSVLMQPDITRALSNAGKISADGRCRSFGREANGFVRGEGAGVVVLKRLSAAHRDRNPVHAIVAGTTLNHNGLSNGLSAPNPAAQAKLIRKALVQAQLRPGDVGYMEASATGTLLGDAIEMRALCQSLVSERPAVSAALLVGSVKSNIGHLEAAGGIAGLIKTVLAIRSGIIPPSLFSAETNPLCAPSFERVIVPQQCTAWDCAADARVAGVNSFGFGGSNACVFLRGVETGARDQRSVDERVHFLPLSARSKPALLEHIQAYLDDFAHFEGKRPGDIAASASCGRQHFRLRAGVLFKTLDELRSGLVAALEAVQALDEISASRPVPRTLAIRFADDIDTATAQLDRLAAGNDSLRRALVPVWPVAQSAAHSAQSTVVAHVADVSGNPASPEPLAARVTQWLGAAMGVDVDCSGLSEPAAATARPAPRQPLLGIALDSLRQDAPMAALISALYQAGLTLRWQELYRHADYEFVPIPGYFWQRDCHWPTPPDLLF